MNMLYNIIFSLKGALNIMALFILFNSAFSQFIPNVKSSSFFVKKETLLDSTKIDSILTFANNNQITKLFIDSFTEGYAIYNSSIIPNHPELDSLFDPLSYILRFLPTHPVSKPSFNWLSISRQHLPYNNTLEALIKLLQP